MMRENVFGDLNELVVLSAFETDFPTPNIISTIWNHPEPYLALDPMDDHYLFSG